MNVSEGRCPHGQYSDKFDLTPYPESKVPNINVLTFDIRNINVPKVYIVEVDLPEQSNFCKLTI